MMHKNIVTKLSLASLFFVTLLLLFPNSGTQSINAQSCGQLCGPGNTCTSPLTCQNGVCASSANCTFGNANCCPACTGDTGGIGACTYAQACAQNYLDGKGTCSNVDTNAYCCAPPQSTGGSADCGDPCSSPNDCKTGLQCTGGLCNSDTQCHICTGTSQYTGVCLDPGVCSGLGRNSNDDQARYCSSLGGNFYNTVCCTNAPSSNSCTLKVNSPYLVGAYMVVDLSSTEQNTLYQITTSSGCTGSCQSGVTTGADGQANCTIDCGPPAGSYTLTATHGSVSCNTTVTVLNAPGPDCISDSGVRGYCVALACPHGYVYDGPGNCTGSNIACCIPGQTYVPTNLKPQMLFCKPGGGTTVNPDTNGTPNLVNTALGCIPVYGIQGLLVDLLPWSIGISGGIAVLLIIYAGFLYLTSAGNPQKVAAAKELITAALSGLALLIFAALLLRIVGQNILFIPGF